MRAGEAVVRALEAFGVDHIFGLPGVHNLPIYDALRDAVNIRTITVRNENAASFMAQGYTRISRKPGVCLLAPGPGMTNALTGIAEAYVNSTPTIVLSGGIRQSSVGKGAIHDVDQLEILGTVTKWCGKTKSFEDIQPLLHQAFLEASSGRPRPTFIEIPLDVQSTTGVTKGIGTLEIFSSTRDLMKAGVVADILMKAERPVIIVGGGVLTSGANSELLALADCLTIPVATTITAKEAIPDSSPLSLGLLNDDVARAIIPEADVILALGCRFAERSTSAWTLRMHGKLIHVDVDSSEIGRNYPVAIGVVCDAKLFLKGLLKLIEGKSRTKNEAFLREIQNLKVKRTTTHKDKLTSEAKPLKPQRVMKELSELLPEGTVVTCDSGNNAWWPMMFLESRGNRHFLFPSGNVSMGFGFPAALGARCVAKKVVSITGDGGFMMQLAELATAVEERLNVTVIILNDGGFGAIRHYQRFNFGARYTGVNFRNPNFIRLAEAFGIEGMTIGTPTELISGLHEAIEAQETMVLDVRIDPDEVALPDWIIQSFGDARKL